LCDGIESFICKLQLERKAVSAAEGICADCDFWVPSTAKGLSKTLFGSQLSSNRSQILRDYGLQSVES